MCGMFVCGFPIRLVSHFIYVAASAVVCTVCTSVSVCKRCGHQSCLTNSYESDSDSLDNSVTLLPHCPHTSRHRDTAAQSHCLQMAGSSDAKC